MNGNYWNDISISANAANSCGTTTLSMDSITYTDTVTASIGELRVIANDHNWQIHTLFNEVNKQQTDIIKLMDDDVSACQVCVDQLKEENKKLRQQIALLNTRVNDILAFFQKNNINIKE